ncbi:unnamed protein product [Brachionus calyciflorus]|uniref:Uncharacterized protein n=1 Tax=Brachionus calyciflorus TaxID=104777 RepID=A0A814H1G8_9BILA|nr:unnamed protein product [Brachionus calyciflorus]
MSKENVDSIKRNPDFQTIKENIFEICNHIEKLKNLINQSKNLNSETIVNIDKNDLLLILNDAVLRFNDLNSKETKKFIRKRALKRKKHKNVNKDNYYDLKLEDLFKSKSIFGGKKIDLDTNTYNDNVNFNYDLDSYNRGLFELKQLNEYAQTLRKLLSVRSKQKNQNISNDFEFQEILKLIDEKRNDYEGNKKLILESIPKSNLHRNPSFNKILKEHEMNLRKILFGETFTENDYEEQLFLEQLVHIRYEWDQFITQDHDRSKTIPIEWVFPNQNPNDEWKQFVKND